MPMKKSKANKAHTGGHAAFFESPVVKKSFGANVAGLLKLKASLAFSYSSVRAEDEEYAGKLGTKISLKIMTPIPACSLSGATDWECRIGSDRYAVAWVSENRDAKTAYFYLEGL